MDVFLKCQGCHQHFTLHGPRPTVNRVISCLKETRTIEERTQTCLDAMIEQEDFPLPEVYTGELDKVRTTLSSFSDIYNPKSVALRGRGNEDKATQTTDDSLKVPEELCQQQDKVLAKQRKNKAFLALFFLCFFLVTSVTTLTRQKEEADSTIQESLGSELMKLSDDMVVLLRQNGIHGLKTDPPSKSFILQCVQLKYDLQKVHTERHINSKGELVNKADTTRPSGNTRNRFQDYTGTTSTVPLSKSQSLQYVELLSDVMIDESLGERNLLLETGICPREERDMYHCVHNRQYCYSLDVVQCPEHNTVCTKIWKDGKMVHHLRDTLPNTAGSHTTLHYGIVYETVRNRMVFLDVKQMEVLAALDNVNYTQSMWPMFGVYAHNSARISMKLVVGNDIDMTSKKKALILKSL